MVERGAVRDGSQPGVPKSGQVFLPARWLTACEFVGSGVKMVEWS